MAFLKLAKAVKTKTVGAQQWDRKIRVASTGSVLSPNLVEQASDILGEKFTPDRYLLSHATIVCSVDTEVVPNVRTGSVEEGGLRVNRKYPDYWVTSATERFLNNNHDGWSRGVIEKSYQTFIGAQNYCFAPGTPILMADGTYKPIEQVELGDEVISHTGEARKVVHLFRRKYEGEVRAVKFDRYKDPVLVTGNHPFRRIEVNAPPLKTRTGTKTANALRYRRDQITKALRGDKNVFKGRFSAEKTWTDASDLQAGDYVLSPERKDGDLNCVNAATVLGYYMAEGCATKQGAVVFTFGSHETALAEDCLDRLRLLFPDAPTHLGEGQGTLRVSVRGHEVESWFTRMGGRLSHAKVLSKDVFGWSRESLLRLLAGWLTGDGSYHKGTLRLRGFSVSKDLSQQMLRIAELCGVKACLTFCPQKIGEVVSQVELVVGGEPRQFDVIPRHNLWTLTVSKDSVGEIVARSLRWGSPLQQAPKKRADFAWWGGCRVHKVFSNKSVPYCGEVFNFEVEVDNSYVIYPGIAVHNCEHVQIPEHSKGRIVDAVLRDVGDSLYVDILVATDRKHKQLVQDIESGRMSTMSMGCSVDETGCTKCGHVASDETTMCQHVKYAKGNKFYDDQGNMRRIAELCGHESLGGTAGVHFIEGSWVAIPAFGGAVLRNLLQPRDITPDMIRRAQEILSTPPSRWTSGEDMEGMIKAASLVALAEDTYRNRQAFSFGDDEEDEGGGDGGGGDGKSPLEELEDRVLEVITRRVEKRVQEDLGSDKDIEGGPKRGDKEPTAPNDSLQREARLDRLSLADVYQLGISSLARTASSNKQFVRGLRNYNAAYGVRLSDRLYKASLKLGSSNNYPSLGHFARACSQVLGRRPSLSEVKTLVRIAKLLSLRERSN